MPQHRPPRADAVRNRARILEAADGQIVAHGPEVAMELIAEAAGVAVGTLYRHFPTKGDLVGAVIESHLEQVASETEVAADRVDAGSRAFDELADLVRRFVETAASNKAAKAAARALGAEYDPGDRMDRARAALGRLISAGQGDGDLRADLTAEDCYLLFSTAPIDQPAPVRERWLDLMLDGFRAAGSGP